MNPHLTDVANPSPAILNQVEKNPLLIVVDNATHDLLAIRDQLIKEPKKNDNDINHYWVKIYDKSITKSILENYVDPEKKGILEAALEKPRTESEIVDVCNLPQTSYHKINSLVENHFLIPNGLFLTDKGTMIKKYSSILEDMAIDIARNEIVVRVKFAKIYC